MIRSWWATALVASLAAMYGWIGLAAHGPDRVLGVAGGLLIVAALALARRSLPTAVVVLVLGTAPLAVAAWWSIAAPLLGLLTLPLGWWALRTQATAHEEVADELADLSDHNL